jgi:hypothetical protein
MGGDETRVDLGVLGVSAVKPFPKRFPKPFSKRISPCLRGEKKTAGNNPKACENESAVTSKSVEKTLKWKTESPERKPTRKSPIAIFPPTHHFKLGIDAWFTYLLRRSADAFLVDQNSKTSRRRDGHCRSGSRQK